MANANAPFGLKPINRDGTAANDFAVGYYQMLTTDANNIFIGDPVLTSGTADPLTGYATIVKGTAGSGAYFTGAVVAVIPVTEASTVYRAASTYTTVLVADDPDQLFAIQSNGTTVITNVGANADFSFGSGGSTASGVSGGVLNESTANTTATLQLRIERLADPNFTPIGAFGQYQVRINLHQKRNTTGQ